jgi:hypothetical protein
MFITHEFSKFKSPVRTVNIVAVDFNPRTRNTHFLEFHRNGTFNSFYMYRSYGTQLNPVQFLNRGLKSTATILTVPTGLLDLKRYLNPSQTAALPLPKYEQYTSPKTKHLNSIIGSLVSSWSTLIDLKR